MDAVQTITTALRDKHPGNSEKQVAVINLLVMVQTDRQTEVQAPREEAADTIIVLAPYDVINTDRQTNPYLYPITNRLLQHNRYQFHH